MRRLLTVTVTAFLALVLTACQGESEVPEPRPTPTGVASGLVPGACVAASGEATVLGDTAVTESALVDCDQEHIYEVLAVQDIPSRYISGTEATDEDLVRLQASLDGSRADTVQVAFASFAHAYCDIALQRQLGLDSGAELAGTDIASLQVVPMSHTSATYAVLPAEGWTEQPSLLCVNRLVADSPTPSEAPVAPVTGAVTAGLLSAERPLAQRLCFSFDAAGNPSDTTCEAQHDAEYTVTFDATRLLDADQIAASSVDPAGAFPDDVQELLDQACDDALDLVIGQDHDESVIGGAQRGSQGWGTGGLTNAVNCFAAPEDPELVLAPGSVFGLGDTPIELVARS